MTCAWFPHCSVVCRSCSTTWITWLGLMQVNGAVKATANGAELDASGEDEEETAATSGQKQKRGVKEKGGKKSFIQANQSKSFFADLL